MRLLRRTCYLKVVCVCSLINYQGQSLSKTYRSLYLAEPLIGLNYLQTKYIMIKSGHLDVAHAYIRAYLIPNKWTAVTSYHILLTTYNTPTYALNQPPKQIITKGFPSFLRWKIFHRICLSNMTSNTRDWHVLALTRRLDRHMSNTACKNKVTSWEALFAGKRLKTFI